MNKTITFFLFTSMLCISAIAKSEEAKTVIDNERNFERVHVQWLEPKKYTDIRPSNQTRAKFRKHVFAQLEDHFNELSEKLPNGQSINIKVTNIDLAGRVEPGAFVGFSSGIDDIRIMRDIDIPRIEFEYELLSDSGEVLKAETVKLKDMNYLFHSNHAFISREAFGYEKRMLTEWFDSNLIES